MGDDRTDNRAGVRRAGVRRAVETFVRRRRRAVTNGGLNPGRFQQLRAERDDHPVQRDDDLFGPFRRDGRSQDGAERS